MSVNPSASFSSLNFQKLLGDNSNLFDQKKQTVDVPALLDQASQLTNLNPNEAAASKLGIAHHTQRTRLAPGNEQNKQSQTNKAKGTNGALGASNPDNVAKTNVNKNAVDDPIAYKTEVTLVNKPVGMPLGEYLTRQSLEKIASEYGLNSTDIDLQIQHVKNNKAGKFIDNLSFGKTKIENPDKLTDSQVKDLIAKGNQTVDFGIHRSTVEQMLERKAVLKWVAEKEAFGGQLSEQDLADLKHAGYSETDLQNMRRTKFMEYGGFQVRFEAEIEAKAKGQVYQGAREELKNTLTEQNARANAQGNPEAFELLMKDAVEDRVQRKLANGNKSAVQYLTEQAAEQKRIEAQGELSERLKQYSVTDYLTEGGKNLANSLSSGIGDVIKGAAMIAVNNTVAFDKNMQPIEPNVSQTLGYKIGDWMQQNVRFQNVNPDIEQSFSGGTVPSTIGGLAPAIFGTWVTKKPMATVSIYNGLRTGGNVYDEAIRQGASETQAQRAGLITGGFIAVTDRFGYGKTLEALNTGAGAKTWQTIFQQAMKEGARNAGVAGVQTVGENTVARNTFDPERAYLANVEERMKAAGITGAALKGGLEIIAKVRAGADAQVLTQTQKLFNLTEVTAKAKADLVTGLPKLRETARVNILNETVPLSQENGGAIFRTVGDKTGELKYLQTMRSRDGVVLKPLTAEQYAKAKGSVPEVEISKRQFDAANGVRLTANGKITTIDDWRLAKNLDSAQGINLREPRLVTPTNAELIRKIEVQSGMQKVETLRQEYKLTTRDLKKANVAYSDFEIDGQKWTRVAVSGQNKVEGTAPIPDKRYFKTRIDVYDRAYDTEVKLLEEFAAKYADRAKEVKGTIYLFTERPPCGSCTDVLPQFRKMFPNIKLEVADGGYKEKVGVKK